MTKDIDPLGDRVLVVRGPADSESGGLVVPESAQEPRPVGTVVKAGPGRVSPETGQRMPMPVEEGDRVLFHEKAGTEVDDDHLLVREANILAVLA